MQTPSTDVPTPSKLSSSWADSDSLSSVPRRRSKPQLRQCQILPTLPNAGADVDEAIAAISAPLFATPTRLGTAGGFLRFGGAGGERRWTVFFIVDPLAVDVLLIVLPAGLGGERPSKERTDTGESGACTGGTASAPPGERGDAGS